MDSRVGFRIGGAIAVATCALLVACGGGGGGGVTPGGGPTPTLAPTIAPTSQSTTAAVAPGKTPTVNLGAVSNGGSTILLSSSVRLPSTSASATATVSVSASKPGTVLAPQMMRMKFPATINRANLTVLAYFGLSFNPSVNVTSTPQFTLSLADSVSAGFIYLAFYDPTNPSAGWNLVNGNGLPLQTSGGASFALPSVTIPQATLAANQTYYFAVISSASLITPTPPSSTPAAFPTGTNSPLPQVTETPGPNQGWTPYQVANAFQYPVMSGYNGAGQTVVIIGDNPPVQSDLNTFLSRMHISRTGTYTTFQVTGSGPDTSDSGGQGEATLDVETVMGLAPGANIKFYILPDLSDSSFLAAEQYVLTDPSHPSVMSISFGGCEYAGITTDHQYYSQGAARGIAYTASSGDEGDACYSTTQGNTDIFNYGANSPASDPSVIAVGGNENANASETGLGSLTSIKVWNDTFLSGPGASGGGVSTVFTVPSTAQSATSGVLSRGRNVPDIALPAEGVSVYLQGSWQVFGGTSWSAPEAAALIAEMYQACPGLGTSFQGGPAGMFYTASGRYYAGNFIDVTGGNNAYGAAISTPPPVGNPYASAPGYDQASGLGLPLGMPMLSWLCQNRTPGAMRAAIAQSATQVLGPARDTELQNAIDTRFMHDLGERQGPAITSMWLALRNTSTHMQDEQAVISALQAAGMTTRTYPSHMLIQATGPAATVASYFRTQIRNVDQGRHGIRYANATPMIVPASIAPYVEGAIGNDLVTRHRLSYRLR